MEITVLNDCSLFIRSVEKVPKINDYSSTIILMALYRFIFTPYDFYTTCDPFAKKAFRRSVAAESCAWRRWV